MAEVALPLSGETVDQPDSGLSSVSRRAWIFLALEPMLLGILVLLYVAFRDNRPEVIRAGRRYLDVASGAGSAGVLLIGCLAMLGATWAARRGSRRMMIALLAVTMLAGLGFFGMKAVEYDARWRRGLFWAEPYHRAVKRELRRQRLAKEAAPVAPVTVFVADANRGKTLFMETCADCHGANAMGLPKLGLPLVANKFVGQQNDEAMLAFIKAGRGPTDPVNTTGVAMPPRGGNPTLTDEKLRDVVAYLRELQKLKPPETMLAGGGTAPDALQRSASVSQPAVPEPLIIHRCIVPPAADGPLGLSPEYHAMTVREMVDQRQGRLDEFFGLYFAIIGTHGLSVLAGLSIAARLFVRVIWRPLPQKDSGLLSAGGLQWVLASVAWLILFPLLYLS